MSQQRSVRNHTTQSSHMPLFIKTYDFIVWLIPVTNDFPRIHRHTITKRLNDAALDFQEAILAANNVRGALRLEWLTKADIYLDRVRNYLRTTFEWRWLAQGQYEHAGRMVAEIGRLLGGWRKTLI